MTVRQAGLQMIQNTIVSAPDELWDTLHKMTRMQLIRTLAAWRPDLADYRDVVSTYRIMLKSLGRRYRELHDKSADLNTMIIAIIDKRMPALVAWNTIGHASAAQLLLTAGDNVERLHSEASFAALCAVSPVRASSGSPCAIVSTGGGDHTAISALHINAIGRLRTDPRTQACAVKRMVEGHKMKAIRCVKRCIVREASSVTIIASALNVLNPKARNRPSGAYECWV